MKSLRNEWVVKYYDFHTILIWRARWNATRASSYRYSISRIRAGRRQFYSSNGRQQQTSYPRHSLQHTQSWPNQRAIHRALAYGSSKDRSPMARSCRVSRLSTGIVNHPNSSRTKPTWYRYRLHSKTTHLAYLWAHQQARFTMVWLPF